MIATVQPEQNLLQRVSASRLGTFHQCRLKFYFRYVLGLKKSKPVALHVGSTVHSVLQEWNRARWKQLHLNPEAIEQLFAAKWHEEQQEEPVNWEGEYEAMEKDAAWKLLQTYLAQTPILGTEKPEAVEVSVEADLTPHGLCKIVGIIDLVRPGGRIVDFKTAGQTPNPEKAAHLHETQLSTYALLYRDATDSQESGMELHHLIKLKNPKIVVSTFGPMTEQQKTRLFKVIDSYLNGVSQQDWVPNPSPMSCSCCEYFNECRNWG